MNPSSDTPPVKTRSRSSTTFLKIVLVLLVLGGLGWFFLRPAQTPQTKGRGMGNQPISVATATIEKGSVDITLKALGTVTPLADVTVRTQINGQLMDVAFQEGQTVQKGDFLAQIDARLYKNQLAQAQGALQRDQALLKEAEVNLQRYKKLVAQNSLARQQLDTQESLVQQYQGNIKTDEAQIATAQLNISYCHITAPVTGRVGLRQVDPGNYVQTSDTNGIVTITQLHPISVLFSLPEDNLASVMRRVKEGVTLEVTALDRTQSAKLATGTLASYNNQIDTGTGTFKLRALFDNPEETLFPNQFVNIQLLVETLNDVTLVPNAALQTGSLGTFVYLVKPDSSVTVRAIKTGETNGLKTVVTEGLVPGDNVVVDGMDKLREGSKVTLPQRGQGSEARGQGKSE